MTDNYVTPSKHPLYWAAVICLLCGLFAASAVEARPGKGPIDIAEAEQRSLARFETVDQNDDDLISLEEFENAPPPRRAADRMQKGEKRMDRKRMARKGMARRGKNSEWREARRAAIQDEIFAILDTDGNGQLSREEASAQDRKTRHLAAKRVAFKRLDADSDGTLTQSEMSVRLDRLKAADSDGDGIVTMAELRSSRASD